eukprot:6180602-Pleurochrysis_carterae.AAC.2
MGKREFAPWLKANHGASFYIPLERADGGRQDIGFDDALPIYINRRSMVAFLKDLVFQLEHSYILEDFLWTMMRSEETVAFCRACTLFDLLIFRPLRWLACKAATLLDWSAFKMRWVYDLLEEAMVAAADCGAYLYQPTLSVFQNIADEQPLFKKHLETNMREEHALRLAHTFFSLTVVLARRHTKVRPVRARAGKGADANGRDQPGRHRNDDRAHR